MQNQQTTDATGSGRPPVRRSRPITRDEIESAIDPREYPPVLTPDEAARLLRVSKSTIYHMVSRGCYRDAVRRGKPLRFWRDRLVRAYFKH